MQDFDTIEELVRSYVIFRHGSSREGWNPVFCEVCGDGSRRKGPRGGWLFSDGGRSAFYHCFNCGCKESASLDREYPFSKGMRNVFDKFGIPASEYNQFIIKTLKNKKDSKPNDKENKKLIIKHQEIELPEYFIPLLDLEPEKRKEVRKFLKEKYRLSINDYSFYYCDGMTNVKNKKELNVAKLYKDRLIIPFFKRGKCIYYQARDITGKNNRKYISADVPKNNIFFNIDEIYRITDSPLYVVEGPMDAIHLGGVATLGNELSKPQIEMLKYTNRQKILVPDFGGDSAKLCEQFIENGWYVSFPEYRKEVKDVSESIIKYGKILTLYDIRKNIKNSDEAYLLYKFMNL